MNKIDKSIIITTLSTLFVVACNRPMPVVVAILGLFATIVSIILVARAKNS